MKQFLFFPLLFLIGCASSSNFGYDPELNQSQVREIQTRTFTQKDMKTMMKSVISVLQDEGFIIKNANLDLGLISAEKDVDIESKWSVLFSSLVSGDRASWRKHALLEVSSDIISIDSSTKVRANFQVKIFDNLGRIIKVNPVTNMQHYKQFFIKINEALGQYGSA